MKNKIPVANAWMIYQKLFVYVKPYLWAVCIAGLASLIYSGVDAGFVYALKPLLNKGLINKDTHFLSEAPLIVLGLFFVRGGSGLIGDYYIALASRYVIQKLRSDVFSHLQKLPARFYDQTTTGNTLTILVYGVDQVSNASADILTTALQSGCLVLGLIGVMFSISWKLTLLYFALIPFILIVMRYTSLRVRRLSLSIQSSIADINHCAEENIQGYKVVRSFSGQEQEIQRFNQACKSNRQREMKVVLSRSLSGFLVQLLSACGLGMTLWIAAFDIQSEILSPGGFVSLCAAMLAILKPMKDLAYVQNKLYRGLAGAQSVFELLEQPTEIDTGKYETKRVKGDIICKNISFSYENALPVLQNIELTIPAGKMTALVGRSGSGKSTLVNLFPLFYRGFSGEILLDGISIADYQLKNLREQFALVSQHVILFHDTVLNNIAYGSLHKYSKEAVIEAAKAAHADEFITQLPQGYDSIIGENGVLLSGGQRQRIAIARAILKNAPILILDEATASLDTESERHIQAALINVIQGRTTIVIAHRLSTIEHADQIIVLEHGKILEVGKHDELLKRGGRYAQLHQKQFQE